MGAYEELHATRLRAQRRGPAPDGDSLAGGLYGVAIGGLFAGESMFSHRRDASKAALVALVEDSSAGGGLLLDVQWLTPHLASLGAVEIPRARYLELVADRVDRGRSYD